MSLLTCSTFTGDDAADHQANIAVDTDVDTAKGRRYGVGRQLLHAAGHEARPDVHVSNGESAGEEGLDNRA